MAIVGYIYLQTRIVGHGVLWIGLRVVYWNGYYTEDAPGTSPTLSGWLSGIITQETTSMV